MPLTACSHMSHQDLVDSWIELLVNVEYTADQDDRFDEPYCSECEGALQALRIGAPSSAPYRLGD